MSYQDTAGYVRALVPGHPMADPRGWGFEHRMVLYDKLGGANPNCHWCGAVLTWGTLHTDHLDDDKTNNAPENLAPSCSGCNTARGIRRKHGITFNGETLSRVQWSKRLGLSPMTVRHRLATGWSVERALTEPKVKPTGVRR
jgi:hypothetical protein